MAIKLIIRRQGASAAAPPLAERVYTEPMVTIGSDPAATLSFDDPAIAFEQAAILANVDGQLLLINRADGTRLNDETLAREAHRPIADGDTLFIGSYVISLQTDARPTAATSAPATGATNAAADEAERRDARRASQSNATRQTPPAQTPPTQQQQSPLVNRKAAGGGFGTLLDSLLTEEDRFYFEIVSATNGRSRVVIEGSEMLVGWDATGQQISCNAVAILAPRAVVRKDLGGVVIEPQAPGTISVNGEALEGARRLRDGDRLTLLPTPVTVNADDSSLIFHEPVTLMVLDSVLPSITPAQPPTDEATPPTVDIASEATQAEEASAQLSVEQASARRAANAPASERKYFGYFTFTEIIIMIFGTLFAAVIIFLVLEYL